MAKRRRKAKADKPFDILADLRSGPVLKRKTPAYEAAKGVIRTFSLVKRLRRDPASQKPDLRERQGESDAFLDVRQRSDAEQDEVYQSVMEIKSARLCAENLPALFVGALAEPRIAQMLPGYISKCSTFWAEYDICVHDDIAWLPAYVEFLKRLPGSEIMLERIASDIGSRIEKRREYPQWFGVSAADMLILAFLRRQRDSVRDYVDTARGWDVVGKAKLRMELGLEPDLNKDVVAYRALLFAVLGLADAVDLVDGLVSVVICGPEMVDFGEHQAPEEGREPSSYVPVLNAEVWGLVHSLVGLGPRWEYYFAGHAKERMRHPHPSGNFLVYGKLQERGHLHVAPEYLAFPEIGGERFADLNRRVCADVAGWYRAEAATVSAPRRPADGKPAERAVDLRRLAEKHPAGLHGHEDRAHGRPRPRLLGRNRN